MPAEPVKPLPRGVTRRRFLVSGALAGAAAMATISLAGCTGADEKKVTGEPQVITDDSKIVNVTDGDDYKSVDNELKPSYTWSLPLGTVVFHSEGSWAAVMMAPASAREPNTLGAVSLTSTSVSTLVEKPSQGSGFGFYDVRCGSGTYAWVEMDFATGDWVLIGQEFSDGQLAGEAVKLDSGNADWEPSKFTVSGTSVIWLKMPLASGSKRAEDSHCYQWSVGNREGREIMASTGRFATPPRVSEGVLTIAPRVNNDEGVFYGISALNLSDGNKLVDQLVMPETVAPFDAVYMGDSFAFSVEANYNTGGSLGNMGTFIGREGGPFVFLSREPLACVAGKGSRYLIKAQSSHFVLDTKERTYAVLTAPDKTLEYGDYPASEGVTDRFATFATVRGDDGLPASVTMRVFEL